MKPVLKNLLWCAAAAMCLASCADESPWGVGSGKGMIELNLNPSDNVSSAVPQVRADVPKIPVPPSSEFSISLTRKSDGFVKTYRNLEAFSKESGFSVGSYSIAVKYGDETSQGLAADDNDYSNSFFYGLTDNIEVREGVTTDINLEAALENSIVRVEYADAFKKYFSEGYSTTIQSGGHLAVNAGDKERNVYVIPGEVSVTITGKLQNGNTVQLKAQNFTAKKNNMYKLRYTIYNNEVGTVQLGIILDESLTTEEVLIDITDDIANTAPPVVEVEGYESGHRFELPQGTPLGDNWFTKFNVVAPAMLKSAVLKLNSDTYQAPFMTYPSGTTDGEIDLCAMTEYQKTLLDQAGVVVKGIENNSDKWAQVDLKGICGKLPKGTHTFSLEVTDKADNVSQPVSIVVTPVDKTLDVYEPQEVMYDQDVMNVTFLYNGTNAALNGFNPLTFAVMKNGNYITLPAVVTGDGTSADDFKPHSYTATIKVPDMYKEVDDLYVFDNMPVPSGNDVPFRTLKMPFKFPEFTMDYDAYATYMKIRVSATNYPEALEKIRIFVNDVETRGERDDKTGLITLQGLTPSTDYTIKGTFSKYSASTKNVKTKVSTEDKLDVPNGDFSQTTQTINISSINAGGEYGTTKASKHQNTSSILINEPTGGWASVNKLTCYEGSSKKNTWFLVPSTLIKDGAVLLRNVDYDHNGTLPEFDAHTLLSYGYYSANAPQSFNGHHAGELFLGSYNYNGSEMREEGISFTSRPSSLTFDYSYTLKEAKDDKAEVSIYILDSQGNVLSSAVEELTPVQSRSKTVDLDNYAFGVKASKLKLKFRSSKSNIPPTVTPSGKDALKDASSSAEKINANEYKSLSTGSELVIDNVKLNY